MDTEIRRSRMYRAMGWLLGTVSGLLLLSAAGLGLFVQAHGDVSVALMLLASYVGAWSYMLSLIGFVFFSVWWLVGWRRARRVLAAMSQHRTADGRRQRVERLSLRRPRVLEGRTTAVVPRRLSTGSDQRSDAVHSPEVA